MKDGEQRAADLMSLMADGLTQKEAAARLGMKAAAACKCLKRFKRNTEKALAMSPAAVQVLSRQMDEISEVQKLAEDVHALIGLIKSVLDAPSESVLLDRRRELKRVCDGSPDKFLVSLMAEKRKLMELHFTMREKWANMDRVVEFQRVVMEEIQKESPETARRIVAKLVQTRAIRDSIDVGGL